MTPIPRNGDSACVYNVVLKFPTRFAATRGLLLHKRWGKHSFLIYLSVNQEGIKHFPATLRLYSLKKKRKTPPRELKTFGINTIVFITLRDKKYLRKSNFPSYKYYTCLITERNNNHVTNIFFLSSGYSSGWLKQIAKCELWLAPLPVKRLLRRLIDYTFIG